MLLGDGPFNVVRVGGSGYSVLTRDARGVVSFEANERCSAGTGETVEGLCNRLGRDLDEAVRLAEASPDGLVVTSRCAVFAKSELTHYANEGEDHGRLFRGLFEGVARNVHALYDRVKVEGPVLLVGHGALIAPAGAPLRGARRRAGDGPARGRRVRGAGRAARCRAARAGARCRAVPCATSATPRGRTTPRRSSAPRATPCALSSRRRRAPARSSISSARRATIDPARAARPRSRPRLDRLQGRPRRPRRRARRRRLPAHRRQPGRSGQGAGRRDRRDAAQPGRRHRSDRLGARRRGDRRARRVPRARARGSRSRTRSSPTPRRRSGSTRTAAAASRSSRSAARTPSSSTCRTGASSSPT